jgi:hypothetical protein
LFKGGEVTDKLYLSGSVVGATEDDILLHIMMKLRPVCGMRVGCAWAYSDVVCPQTETV